MTGSLAHRRWFRIALPIFLIAVAIAAFFLGLQLRKNAYAWTEQSHYYGDAFNAYRYGYIAYKYQTLLDYPELISKGVPEYSQGKFDYPPLRLTMSYLYAMWVAKNFQPVPEAIPHWVNYTMIAPMLAFNTFTECISAIFVFLLIRLWTIRADDARRPQGVPPAPYRGCVKGLIGAMIFWFNPAILMNAHAWPQWDVWFFPFVLGAMLLASVDAWLLAGALLAIGANFKGQVLLSLPIFVLWPLFRGRPGSILSLAGGFVLAFGAVAMPWMRPTTSALIWFLLLNISLALIAPFVLRFNLKFGWLIGLVGVALLLAWPWQSQAAMPLRLLPLALLALAALARLIPPRLVPAVFSLCIGLAAFAVIPLFNGKTYWYDVAYEYGARKFMTMAVVGTHNLPSILVSYFRIGGAGEGNPLQTMDVPLLGQVIIRKFLLGLNLLCAVICGIGAAMHSRKPDTRMLLALTTPMLCAFVVMPQLNNRYAVWAAGLSALLAGVSVELSLLGILISVVAWEGMAQLMYIPSSPAPGRVTEWSPYLPPLSTHLGWIMILSAAIYLYMIFAPRKPLPRSSQLSIHAPSLDHETPAEPREMSFRRRIRNWTIRIVVILFLIGISLFALYEGLEFRKWTWSATAGVHFVGDVENAYSWGSRANQENLFQLYDNIESHLTRNGPKQLDYPPLRLAAATAWVKWTQVNFKNSRGYRDDYAFTSPMLRLNVICEILCSIFIFMLIRMWAIRMDDGRRRQFEAPRPFRGVIRGMIGAMLFWFNPAIVWVGHGWPQWDVWLLPFYLAAVLLACADFWFFAGICLAIGAFFKGQILFAAPLLLIWPLLRIRFDHVLQLLAGMTTASAAIAFLWIKPSVGAFTWFMLMIVAITFLLPFLLRWKIRWIWPATAATIAMLLAWPWRSDASLGTKSIGPGLIAVVALSRLIPSRLIPHVCAMVIAASVFLIIPLFHGSTGWYTIGFEAGTTKFMSMTNATAYNVPESLVRYFHWSSNPNTSITLAWTNIQISARNLLLWSYGICLLISGIGAAIHSRRPDTRFLVAVAAPWLCAFVLLTQINNRYLVWAAGLSALMAGVGLGMTLLGILVTLICMIGVADILDAWRGQPWMQQLVAASDPHLVWMLILIAGIYLCIAVTMTSRSNSGNSLSV